MDIVEVLVCFFLGFLGIHRFMRKHTITGIVYLLTLGLGGIGVIVDLIFLIMDKELLIPK